MTASGQQIKLKWVYWYIISANYCLKYTLVGLMV